MYYSSNERVKIVFINGNSTYISTISGDLRSRGGGGGGGGGVLKKVLYGEAPPRGPTPYPFIYHFFSKKAPLSYTFYWKKAPLSYT